MNRLILLPVVVAMVWIGINLFGGPSAGEAPIKQLPQVVEETSERNALLIEKNNEIAALHHSLDMLSQTHEDYEADLASCYVTVSEQEAMINQVQQRITNVLEGLQ